MASDNLIRFGVFELDLAARELRKRGVRVRLRDQPCPVLSLIENAGRSVDAGARAEWAGARISYG